VSRFDLPVNFVTESTLHTSPRGLHVAIIMDGNGRWAARRGRPRPAGHIAGARTARQVVEAAARAGGVGTLTLYAFSADNWRRPEAEVAGLMRLFRRYLAAETARCVANGVRLTVVGRRDRLPAPLVHAIEAAEQATQGGRALRLRVALDYSARDAIVAAACRAAAADEPPDALTRERFAALLGEVGHEREPVADVDLLVRTGGEQRLSDFLLWECAYAELVFSPVLWPEFGAAAFDQALQDYARRERRFGGVVPQAAAAG
jgi:undecaprenyl diphosphate synthase